ncbi:MAG: hypothetical protein ACPGED_11455, partial [Flavobacteriales bacterium]
VGIKVFNVILFSSSLLLLIKIGKKLAVNGALAGLMLLACPMLAPHVLSGLTEPLFAFFLLLALYLSFDRKWISSAIVLSFLPFIRSEGWIIILAFLPFFIHQKQFKPILFLTLGTFIYSIAGFTTHHDLLWVFTKTPYINQGDNYGSGNYFHFANQLFYWCGPPVCALFILGLINLLSRWQSLSWKWALILGLFFAFFGAHSFFWGSGLFHSMGLARVLICILPLLALVASSAFVALKRLTSRKLYVGLTSLIITLMLAFPSLSRKRLTKYTESFQLHPSQLLINRAMDEIDSRNDLGISILHCSAPWAKYRWQEIKGFNTSPSISAWKEAEVELILWDGYFSPLEEGITQNQLREYGFTRIWEASNKSNERNVVSLWVQATER